jgi:limonene-1,2-epoxide hydrolase
VGRHAGAPAGLGGGSRLIGLPAAGHGAKMIALAQFAAAYADQTEVDFAVLRAAADAGRIVVEDV